MKSRWLWLGLLILAAATHIIGLSHPRQVVFDEVHFGKFISAYCCTGERFFDIHPPHAKILIAATAGLGGYRGNFSFDHIGQEYGALPVAALRLLPAATGILLPLIFFVLLRQLGASDLVAFLGGLTLVLDNALLIQTRIIALDGLLLVATFGAISAALARRPILAGALAGLAVGTKFTGLTAPIMVIAIMIFQVWLAPRSPEGRSGVRFWLPQVLLMTLAVLVVYTAGWWLHWRQLPQAGPGDAWMVPTGNFLADTVKMHQLMLGANYNLAATHQDASSAWQWPLMRRPVYYWAGQGADIYFIGNPVVWWGSTILLLIALVSAIRKFENWKLKIENLPLWLPLLGYIVSYVPLLRVPRALFLYHYLTPLLFALLLGLLWLDKTKLLTHYSLLVTRCFILALTIGFIIMSPLTWGLTVPGYQLIKAIVLY